MILLVDENARAAILQILEDAKDLTIATNRADGYPQATVVSFVRDGDIVYFGCDPESQKARNIARDDRISITVTPPYVDWEDIRGLSMAARAERVENEKERLRVAELMLKRFPQVAEFIKSGAAEDIALYKIVPEVISVLDYSRGFGHAELLDANPLMPER